MKMTNEQLHVEILELKQDIREIKRRLLDPDDGVIARININTRMEFDMKDQMIRNTIITTQEDVEEIKKTLEKIEDKLYNR